MTTAKTKKTIRVEEIATALTAHDTETARKVLYARLGARLTVGGAILKTIKRDGLKLLIEAEPCAESRCLKVFADIPHERERTRFKELKLRKGKTVKITGDRLSFGSEAVCLSNCRIFD